ncbi:MAG TPA: ABC transporter permease, partial [Candidatus Binatia bacterium]|nr:ABC transporter permease [Candidatus Binatia bacterium]
MNDLKFAFRQLLKNPGFTTVAVLTLALGIGANTAIFSLLDAVVLKRLPVRAAEELVLFNWLSGPKRMARSVLGDIGQDPTTGLTTSTSFSYLTFERLRDHDQALADVFAFTPRQLSVNTSGEAEIVSGQLVSGGYYAGLGVRPMLGRTITVEDDKASSSPVAVITHRYWQRRFGLDPSIVGKTITVDNIPSTVIGVTPPGFHGALQIGQSPDVSIPLALEPQLSPANSRLGKPWIWWLRVMARLKPGVSAERGRAGLEVIFQQSAQEGWSTAPVQDQEPRDLPRLRAADGSQGLTELRGKHARSLTILMLIVGVVLLIACANIANLLLTRAETRRKEMAVQLALGAGRSRSIRQLLTESVLLAGIGGALGAVLAHWGKDLLLALQPWGGVGLALDLRLDYRVLGFTTAVSLLTGLLFGLGPAFHATRIDLTPVLNENARNFNSGARSSLTKALVIVQVALSLVLLIGAGLFTRTLRNLQSLEAGFNRENLLTFGLDPKPTKYQSAQIPQLYRRLLERMEVIPGVRSATLSQYPLLAGSRNDAPIFVRGQTLRPGEERRALVNEVAANFLDTLEIPILRGRGLSARDDDRAPKVAVINQALARRYFGNEDPIGQRFGLGGSEASGQIEIVGIAKDAKYFELRGEMPPTVYLPYFQALAESACFAVRTTGEPASLIAQVRQAVRELDGNLPLIDLRTLRQQVEGGWAQERFFANLSGFFGLLALLLAAIGMYGVIAYGVTRRTNEIGVRLALGAQRRDVTRLVMRESLLLVTLGIGIGLATALAMTGLISNRLFGITPNDPVTIALATLLLVAVAALASYLPARRAAR